VKPQTIILVLLLVALVVVVATRKAVVIAGKPTIKPSSKGRLVDPCPGDGIIWDAPSGKCIPLVEEPVSLIQ